jgi:hypothetical protein
VAGRVLQLYYERTWNFPAFVTLLTPLYGLYRSVHPKLSTLIPDAVYIIILNWVVRVGFASGSCAPVERVTVPESWGVFSFGNFPMFHFATFACSSYVTDPTFADRFAEETAWGKGC